MPVDSESMPVDPESMPPDPESMPPDPESNSVPRAPARPRSHEVYFSGGPAGEHAVVAAHEEAAVVVDAARGAFVARVAAHTAVPQAVSGLEADTEQAEAAGDDDVEIAV
jgi:hypothetical protein